MHVNCVFERSSEIMYIFLYFVLVFSLYICGELILTVFGYLLFTLLNIWGANCWVVELPTFNFCDIVVWLHEVESLLGLNVGMPFSWALVCLWFYLLLNSCLKNDYKCVATRYWRQNIKLHLTFTFDHRNTFLVYIHVFHTTSCDNNPL